MVSLSIGARGLALTNRQQMSWLSIRQTNLWHNWSDFDTTSQAEANDIRSDLGYILATFLLASPLVVSRGCSCKVTTSAGKNAGLSNSSISKGIEKR